MDQIEIILRTTDPAGKVTEQLLARFDTEKPATESAPVLEYSGLCMKCYNKVVTEVANKI